MYDLAIIGGGPAGVAAGVYAARKRLKTILITESFGGQSVDSMGVENWIGTIKVTGPEFAKMLEEHLRAYVEDVVDIKVGEWVKEVEREDEEFEIETDKGKYKAKTVLVTTGSTRRKLDVLGAEEFEHKGITYCASCDGPVFAGQDVVVIGGGNAAFETAAQMLAIANSVILLNRSDKFKADPVTVEKVLSNPKMKAIKHAKLKEVKGDKMVSSVIYEKDDKEEELKVTGVFVEIGLIPATKFVKDVVPLNKYGQIEVDPRNQRTKTEGIWAAGDSTDGLYHQNNIAAGDAVKALEDIYLYLHAR